MKIKTKLIQTKDYLLLIDEEAEIKPNDLFWYRNYKILLCTGINNTFILTDNKKPKHSSFGQPSQLCKKIIAYYPLNSEAEELDLPLLPNPFYKKTDVVALAIEKYGDGYGAIDQIDAFKAGYKAAQSKQFNSNDMILFAEYVGNYYADIHKPVIPTEELLNSFIQSLSTQQLSKEFVPEYEYYYHSSKEFYKDAKFEKCSKEQYELIKEEIPTCPVKTELKTMTNSEGREELVGTYKY